MKAWLITACAATLMLFSAPAWVHHSYAMFDTSRKVSVSGTITEFHWTNPHASFKVSALTPTGASEVWAVEMGSPNNLVREGWKRTTLKPGDKVTVTMTPLRDGSPGGSYLGIMLADGKSLGKPQSGSAQPASAQSAAPAR
ncbi:MAG TPA: DUF6152 family protein [Steroidobacteraceae bacterium]|jgi:hypothetical protein|nr:DUF6152 family protein [Steroidobacteraceae bacterium]